MGLWKIALSRDGHYALLDPEDYLKLYKHNWHLSEDGYAVRHIDRNRTQRMHRDVMGFTKDDDLYVDHINGKRLDNRQENLRAVTAAENAHNVGSSGGSSEYRGVRYREGRVSPWEASGHLDDTTVHVGSYETEWEAAIAAKQWRRENLDGYSEDRDFDSAYFYVLVDPRDGSIRYLGKSVDPEVRYKHHCKPSERQKDTWKAEWLRELMDDEGLAPALCILEEVPEAFWEEREQMWIESLRGSGEPLTNQQLGGQGQDRDVKRRMKTREKLREENIDETGSAGVSYRSDTGKWTAWATHFGKNKYLGQFDTEEEAREAAQKYREENY